MFRAILIVLASTGMLSIGCGANKLVIPDPTIPHEVAQDSEVWIWARTSDGKMAKVKVRLHEGDWCADQTLIEGNRP